MSIFIDDIIRDEKKKRFEKTGVLTPFVMKWGRDGFNQLQYLHYWFGYGEMKNPDFQFMGVRHKWDKRKKGFLISISK